MKNNELSVNNFKINLVKTLHYIFVERDDRGRKSIIATICTIVLLTVFSYILFNIKEYKVSDNLTIYLKDTWYIKTIGASFITMLLVSILGSTFREITVKEKHISFNKCMSIFLIGLFGLFEHRDSVIRSLELKEKSEKEIKLLKKDITNLHYYLKKHENISISVVNKKLVNTI